MRERQLNDEMMQAALSAQLSGIAGVIATLIFRGVMMQEEADNLAELMIRHAREGQSKGVGDAVAQTIAAQFGQIDQVLAHWRINTPLEPEV